MNKNDVKLIIIVLIIVLMFLMIKVYKNNDSMIANVYYEDKIIETIDLNKNSEYTVKGYNGDVVIEVKDKKIRVKEEESSRHLCSKQGYDDVIICLPNKIVIDFSNDNNLDTVMWGRYGYEKNK